VLPTFACPSVLTRFRACLARQPPVSARTDRHNLVAVAPGTAGGRRLVLSSHLDVVPPGDLNAWSTDPFSGEIRDGVLFGRGAYDDKAGVAICLNDGIAAPWSQFPSPNQFVEVGMLCKEAALTVPSEATATCYVTFTPPHEVPSMQDIITDCSPR
jgi:hypothetical protein